MTAISPVRNNYVAVAATSSSTFGTVGAYLHSVIVNVPHIVKRYCVLRPDHQRFRLGGRGLVSLLGV